MCKNISDIKEELQAAKYEELPLFIKKYESDERSGVKSLIRKALKSIDAMEKELARTEQMKKYEKALILLGKIDFLEKI